MLSFYSLLLSMKDILLRDALLVIPLNYLLLKNPLLEDPPILSQLSRGLRLAVPKIFNSYFLP